MTDNEAAKPPTRYDLEKEIWRLTQWRGNAAAVTGLMSMIDEYAEALPGVRVNVTAVEPTGLSALYLETEAAGRTEHPTFDEVQAALVATDYHIERPSDEELARADAAAALDDDLGEPIEYDYRKFGHELVTLLYAASRDNFYSGSRRRRIAELSGVFGNALAEAHWMREAAMLGDELAKAWLADLGDGMAYTDLGEEPSPSDSELLSHLQEVLDQLDPVPPVVMRQAVTAFKQVVTAVPEGEKRCKKCGLPKVLDDFPKDRSYKDGHRHKCKDCVNAESRERETR